MLLKLLKLKKALRLERHVKSSAEAVSGELSKKNVLQ